MKERKPSLLLDGVPPKTVIGRCFCFACHRKVTVGISISAGAYMVCTHSDDDGISCGCRFFWGRADSLKMLAEFRAAGEPVQWQFGALKSTKTIKQKIEEQEHEQAGTGSPDGGKSGSGWGTGYFD